MHSQEWLCYSGHAALAHNFGALLVSGRSPALRERHMPRARSQISRYTCHVAGRRVAGRHIAERRIAERRVAGAGASEFLYAMAGADTL